MLAGNILCFLYLVENGIYDIKLKKIHVPSSVIIFILLLCLRVTEYIRGDVGIYDAIFGCAIGIGLLGVSVFSGGNVGMGDAIVMIICGLTLNLYMGIVVLFIALMFTSVVAIVLLALKRIKRKGRLPFVPFICLSYLIANIWEYAGVVS